METMDDQITKAQAVEEELKQARKLAQERSKLLNEYQSYIQEIRQKIRGEKKPENSVNMYQLDSVIQLMVDEWDSWSRQENRTAEEIRAKLQEIKIAEENEIKRFTAEYDRMIKEEQERERQESLRKEREMEEKRRQQKREALEKKKTMVCTVKKLFSESFDLTKHLTQQEMRILLHEVSTKLLLLIMEMILSMTDPLFLTEGTLSPFLIEKMAYLVGLPSHFRDAILNNETVTPEDRIDSEEDYDIQYNESYYMKSQYRDRFDGKSRYSLRNREGFVRSQPAM